MKLNLDEKMGRSKQALLTGGTKEDYDKGLTMMMQLVAALREPIISFKGWEQSLTSEQKQRVTIERLKQIKEANGNLVVEATDYETCLYLMTASLSQPLSTRWTEIYMHVFRKVFPDKFAAMFGEREQMEADLDDYDLRELIGLKQWLLKMKKK